MDIKVERVFGDENEKSKPIPNPVLTFEQAFGPYPDILKTIYEQEFKEPSPIQSQAWPIILSGEDMIGIAQTGTGNCYSRCVFFQLLKFFLFSSFYYICQKLLILLVVLVSVLSINTLLIFIKVILKNFKFHTI